MSLLQNVHQLLCGSENTRRTMCSRWYSRLQSVWLYRKRRSAFGEFSQGFRPRWGQPPDSGVHGCGQVDNRFPRRIEQSSTMAISDNPTEE